LPALPEIFVRLDAKSNANEMHPIGGVDAPQKWFIAQEIITNIYPIIYLSTASGGALCSQGE